MTALTLVFDAPRRGMAPRHLADLTREEARAAVAELGHAEAAQRRDRTWASTTLCDNAADLDLGGPARRHGQCEVQVPNSSMVWVTSVKPCSAATAVAHASTWGAVTSTVVQQIRHTRW